MSSTRETILSCACDLYMAGGVEGFSMRKLARSVGVTAPALYRHFESREDVLLEVLGEAHDELFRTLSHALSGGTPAERFIMAGDAYLEFALAHSRYFMMIHAFTDVVCGDEVPDELSRRNCSVKQFWHDRVRECVDTKILRDDDLEAIGLTLWAHAYGLISLFLRRLLLMPVEAFRKEYRASFVRLLRGLATEGADFDEGAWGPPGLDRSMQHVR